MGSTGGRGVGEGFYFFHSGEKSLCRGKKDETTVVYLGIP